MSGQSTKATARQIRRAFGPQALGAVNSHADSITDLVLIAAEHQKTLDAWLVERERLKGLRARLKWLVLGR